MKRSPIKRKRAKPRRYKSPRCTRPRCQRIARLSGYCRSHAKEEADRLFSLHVRRHRRCVVGSGEFEWTGAGFDCKGNHQCAHLIPREYYNLRWDERNAKDMCAAHHYWFDNNPLERDIMLRRHFGEDLFAELRAYAMNFGVDWRPAMVALIERRQDDE